MLVPNPSSVTYELCDLGWVTDPICSHRALQGLDKEMCKTSRIVLYTSYVGWSKKRYKIFRQQRGHKYQKF